MYKVAIVGRPNVGKSTLFNRLTRSRKALVGNEPGITRDRIYEIVELEDKIFELVDTGGIVPDDQEIIPSMILDQARMAIGDSDLILLLVDARAGLIPLDESLASLIKSSGKKVWLVPTKVDVPGIENQIWEFSKLGIENIFPVSAEHNLGISSLMEAIFEKVPEDSAQGSKGRAGREIKVAIVGRPNVGKSSLVNKILGENRVIVSEIPGTTRDSVDTPFEFESRSYRIIDTAGIRRKGRTTLKAEQLSVIMARKNMEQADVVILVIDVEEGATHLDATIAGYAFEAGKSIIVAVNKWDLPEKDTNTARKLELDFRDKMKYLDFAPFIFVSALSGKRVFDLLRIASQAWDSRNTRVPTPELNELLLSAGGPSKIVRDNTMKSKVKYCCQVGVDPPTFVLFMRGASLLHFSTVRFIINRLRERYDFFATPIRIIQRPAKKKK
jgi:GTP-binding protein